MKKCFTKPFHLLALSLCFLGIVNAQVTFTNSNTSLHNTSGTLGSNGSCRSGNAMCVVDVDNNGLDDIVKLYSNYNLVIEYQASAGVFTYQIITTIDNTGGTPWGMCAADVDHNGYKDVLFNGGSKARLIKLNNTGTGVLGSVIDLPNGNIFCQNGNFMDVNNDGWEDIFMCNDVNESRLWLNNGSGSFPTEQADGVINFDVHAGTTAPNDESGNYSSVWTDFDNDGDVDFHIIHCRQSQPSGDVRRDDVLFQNNGGGAWVENANTYGLRINDQDWTGSWGDIDNDGDFDLFLTKHNVTSRYYFNDGAGNMTISPNTIAFGNMPMQSLFEDFDNDTYVDLFITGDNDHRLYHNNGNGTFTNVSTVNTTMTQSGTNVLSFAAGDLNHDGKIDVYTSYGGTYNVPGSNDDVYWRNTTSNSNHFITFILNGTTSTHGALGTRVFIYGPWGVQTREVRAGESYGTCNTFHLHFGLGAATTVDSVRINWPSGNTDLLLNQSADQFVTVTEQSCTLSGVSISYSGATTFCSGDSIQLTAPSGAGYSYSWSNGATGQSIYASSTNAYTVTVSTGPICSATSPAVDITVDPVESVTITALGSTTFCPGGSVQLVSSQTSGLLWSTTETTDTITVSNPGSYSVDYTGLCQTWNSNSIVVTNLGAAAPTTTDDIIPVPGTGNLTATSTSTDIKWYDAAVSGTQVGTGTPFTTPFVSSNTTYYAEATYPYGGGVENAGSSDIAGSTYSGNTLNGYLKFDVFVNCTLTSVDVSTDSSGMRIIELRDNVGTVLQSFPVNLAVGTTTVPLNFALTPGTNYQLGTNTAQNNTSFGYNSPRLLRDNSGVSYPYSAPTALSITVGNNGTTDVTNAYYYYFNWVVDVDPTDICISTRTPATVYITAGIADEDGIKLNVYPNPTSDFVNVEFTTVAEGNAILSVFDMLGKKVYDLNMGKISGNVIRTINTATYAKGVYNIRLTVDGKEYNTKVVVK